MQAMYVFLTTSNVSWFIFRIGYWLPGIHAGVSVMFEQQEYTVLESGMRVRVCAVLTGVIETNVEVTLTTSEGTATGQRPSS